MKKLRSKKSHKQFAVFGVFLALLVGGIYSLTKKSDAQVLGASTINPGSTIKSAIDSASSGDTITVNAGTYNERVTLSKSGLTLKANGVVKMQGFTITGSNNVVDGFYVLNSTADHGGIEVKGTDNVVKNNKIEGASMVGILIDGKKNTVESNEILGTLQRKTASTGQCSKDADGMRFFGSGHIIRGNYIHDIKFEPNPTAHMDCFQSWNWTNELASNIVIEGNVCHVMEAHVEEASLGCRDTTGVSKAQGFMIEDGPNNIKIRNNILSAYRGANFGDPEDSNTTNNIHFTNNTFVGLLPRLLPGVSNNAEYGIFITKASNITASNNIYYNIDGTVYVGSVGGSNNHTYRSDGTGTDPKFANPSALASCKNSFSKPKDMVDCIFAGFKPQVGSPVCGKASDGGDIGAVRCGSVPASPAPTAKIGDADADGDVDGADYVRWALGFNKTKQGLATQGPSDGDFNNLNGVDGADYVIWALNVGK